MGGCGRIIIAGILALNGSALQAQAPAALPGGPASGGQLASARAVTSAIQGNALTALNGPLANALLRLRDMRSGRISATTESDKAGLFIFRRVEPGTYIVELIGNDQTVLAVSQILNIESGQLLSTVVKLPMRVPVAGLLSRTAPAILAVAAASAAAGVLASTATGQPVSPVR